MGLDLILYTFFAIVFLLVMRLLGAWLLRINEIISTLEKILDELKKQRKTLE